MTDLDDLIAEATAHIDNTLSGIGTDESLVRAAWARGEGSDDRFSLLVRLRDRLADALEAATRERDAALARIARAWELHEPFTWSFGYGPVQSCKWCAENGVPQEVASWPCATIRALEEGGIDDGFQED